MKSLAFTNTFTGANYAVSKLLLLLTLLLPINLCQAQIKSAGFDPVLRPETNLEKAEKEGWNEEVGARTEHSALYKGKDGKVVTFQSKAIVNYKNENGQLVPLDMRCIQNGSTFTSLNRPEPIVINSQSVATMTSPAGFYIEFGKTLSLNGKTAFDYSHTELTNSSHVVFENITSGIDKWYDFKPAGVKYSYAINGPQTIESDYLTVREEVNLPKGYTLMHDAEGEAYKGYWKGSLIIVENRTNKPYSKLSPVICFDKNNDVVQGLYKIISFDKKGKYIIEIAVEKSWMNHSSRVYPIVIDPFVTGATALWGGTYIPSCLSPVYSNDSILVTVPPDLYVSALKATSSFYANPFSPAVMADGNMYFSTTCNQTTTFQVTGTAGASPGTAYLDDYDIHAPIMCCWPQSCPGYTFYLRFHMTRFLYGTGCSTAYIYHDPFSGWPFSAYIEGYTPESSGSEMIFTPSTLCADDCDFEAKIFCRYGVPPFTFTHPWSPDVVTMGTPAGCSPGSTFATLNLIVPDCPEYCGTTDHHDVPPPVVTDACGTVVVGYNPSYNLNIKPVAQVTFDQTALSMCSGAVFAANISSCLPGSTITWTSSDGQSGTSTTIGDTIFNTGNSPSTVQYNVTVVTNGCAGIPDSMTVTAYPYADDNFVVTTAPYLVNTNLTFDNQTQLNGNTLLSHVWTFGDSTGSPLDDEIHQYADTGLVTICHYTMTTLGCDDSTCYTILIEDMTLQYPNIITPNGDGTNDALYFKALEYYPANKLEIFNRWGNLLYTKEGYKNDWKGDDLTDGVYYYVLTIKDKEPYKSILHIVRNN